MTVHQNHRAGATDPIDQLTYEHRVILAVLEAMEREEFQLADGGPLDEDFWQRGLDFLAEFADRCHHGKEERILFVELARLGVPDEGGPIGVMKAEHEEARQQRERIEEGLAAGRVDEVGAGVRALVHLLRNHIMKEDDVLFAMARELLTPALADDLAARFEHEEMDSPTHGYVALAREVCADAGVDFDSFLLDSQPPTRDAPR